MRLLLDEMPTPAIAIALRKRGIDIIAVADKPLLHASSDANLLDHAATGRGVVTENKGDFSVLATQWESAGRRHSGLIYTSPKRFNRASPAYPGNAIAALATFVDDPPVTGESWVWWL